MRTDDEGESMRVAADSVDDAVCSAVIEACGQGTAVEMTSTVLDEGSVGLSRVREAVISSHFMQRISQDMRLHLYDADAFSSRTLQIDGATLHGKLFPILKQSSIEYCHQRADAARRRARASFSDFGCASANEVGASEFMTEALMDKEFSRSGARYNDKRRLNLQLKQQIQDGRQIGMVIPALPFKISSPLKSRGHLPDMGEVGFLLGLFEIAKTLELLQQQASPETTSPGVRFAVATDGYRFHEAVNKAPDEIQRYSQSLACWVDVLGLERYIEIVEYKALLSSGLDKDALHAKSKLFESARGDYSRVLWPLFNPMDLQGSLASATGIEPDPEMENPDGRFVSLFKSLIFTLDYKVLKELDGFRACEKTALYREVTANIYWPYDDNPALEAPITVERAVDMSNPQVARRFKERLRRAMLHEAWQAAIDYISEIRSDRDLVKDPVLACRPDHLRWTIHAKPSQLAIAAPPVLGMAVQPWAGSAVFRPMGKGKVRLCSLPALLLESDGAIPVVPGPDVVQGNAHQPLFYIDKALGASSVEQLLDVLAEKFTRRRFS